MKKNIILKIGSVFLFVSSLGFSGCSDLVEDDKGIVVMNSYFADEQSLENGVRGLNTMASYACRYAKQFVWYTAADDLSTYGLTNKGPWLEGDVFNQTAGNSLNEELWNEYYRAISVANSLILNVDPTIKGATAALADAHFIRGLFYFRLASNYGPIPMPLAGQSLEDVVTMKNTPARDVLNQVIEDFNYVLQYADNERDVKPEVYDGHASKTAAHAFLAKVYLQLSGYPYQATAGVGLADKSMMEKVKFHTEAIINAGLYTLSDVYSDNFEYIHQYGNKELIYSHQYLFVSEEIDIKNRFYGNAWTIWMDMYMQVQFFNDVFVDGYRKTFTGGYAAAWNRLGKPGYTTFEHPVVYKFLYACNPAITDEVESDWKSSNDNPAMRYSEVLLMHAEALAYEGNLQGALDDLNMVRRRAYAKGAKTREEVVALGAGFWKNADPSYDKTLTDLPDLNAVVNAILTERACEFVGEFCAARYLDLIRYMLMDDVNDPLVRHKYDNQPNPNYPYPKLINTSSAFTGNYGAERELFGERYKEPKNWFSKIPETDTKRNPNIK